MKLKLTQSLQNINAETKVEFISINNQTEVVHTFNDFILNGILSGGKCAIPIETDTMCERHWWPKCYEGKASWILPSVNSIPYPWLICDIGKTILRTVCRGLSITENDLERHYYLEFDHKALTRWIISKIKSYDRQSLKVEASDSNWVELLGKSAGADIYLDHSALGANHHWKLWLIRWAFDAITTDDISADLLSWKSSVHEMKDIIYVINSIKWGTDYKTKAAESICNLLVKLQNSEEDE